MEWDTGMNTIEFCSWLEEKKLMEKYFKGLARTKFVDVPSWA